MRWGIMMSDIKKEFNHSLDKWAKFNKEFDAKMVQAKKNLRVALNAMEVEKIKTVDLLIDINIRNRDTFWSLIRNGKIAFRNAKSKKEFIEAFEAFESEIDGLF